MLKPKFDMTEPDIQAWCAAYIRKALKLLDIPIDAPGEFLSLELDSAGSVFLVSAIEDWVGLELVSETAIEYPSVALPAHFVAGRLAVKAGGVA